MQNNSHKLNQQSRTATASRDWNFSPLLTRNWSNDHNCQLKKLSTLWSLYIYFQIYRVLYRVNVCSSPTAMNEFQRSTQGIFGVLEEQLDLMPMQLIVIFIWARFYLEYSMPNQSLFFKGYFSYTNYISHDSWMWISYWCCVSRVSSSNVSVIQQLHTICSCPLNTSLFIRPIYMLLFLFYFIV